MPFGALGTASLERASKPEEARFDRPPAPPAKEPGCAGHGGPGKPEIHLYDDMKPADPVTLQDEVSRAWGGIDVPCRVLGETKGIASRPAVVERRTTRACQSILNVWRLYRGGHTGECGQETGRPHRKRVNALLRASAAFTRAWMCRSLTSVGYCALSERYIRWWSVREGGEIRCVAANFLTGARHGHVTGRAPHCHPSRHTRRPHDE